MRPQRQTVFGDKVGNCFSTCVACLLDLSVDDVPNFCAMGDGVWWTRTVEWLGERGITPLMCRLSAESEIDELLPNTYSIASGKSPRGDFDHSVLYFGGKMIHDPHPSDAGLDGPVKDVVVFVMRDPSTGQS